MNHKRVRRWARNQASLIEAVDAAVAVFAASCHVLAAMGPAEQVDATPAVLGNAAMAMTAALEKLAAAPRRPDLPLDLMMAGAIGKLRRCTCRLVSLTLSIDHDCDATCNHTDKDDWADLCVAAMNSWNRFKTNLADVAWSTRGDAPTR